VRVTEEGRVVEDQNENDNEPIVLDNTLQAFTDRILSTINNRMEEEPCVKQ